MLLETSEYNEQEVILLVVYSNFIDMSVLKYRYNISLSTNWFNI
jgi:hypothetical protein